MVCKFCCLLTFLLILVNGTVIGQVLVKAPGTHLKKKKFDKFENNYKWEIQ